MTYATTFSGIGGWELGLNACGWDLQWQCERDPFCQTLLKERFGVPVYDDITTICEHNPPSVDALIGSPPCQPFSVAGKKGGTSDERHLYPAFLALVGHIKPRWVLMEQVPAILSSERGRAFGGYIAGLAALGYSLVWHCIPACAVGANHQRDRTWIIAYANGSGSDFRTRLPIQQREGLSDAHGGGRRGASTGREVLADSERMRRRKSSQHPKAERKPLHTAEREEGASKLGSSGENVAVTQGNPPRGLSERTEPPHSGLSRSRKNVSDAISNGSPKRMAGQAGRRKGNPGEPNHDCPAGFGPQDWPRVDHWATEPELGRVANGIPNRTHRLKGLGNAIVPQIAQIIGEAINQIEQGGSE